MKPQDILFVIALVVLLWRRNPREIALAGIICLLIAMPLFYKWVFFTAQRLTYYAVAFFAISTILHLINLRKEFKRI